MTSGHRYNIINKRTLYYTKDRETLKINNSEEITFMYDKLKEILVEELQIDEKLIVPDAELIGDLNINSIELADLVMICEEKFDIEIEEDQLTKFVTVGDVVDYLETIA